MAKEIVTLVEFGMYDLDRDLDLLIKDLQEYQAEAKRQGLTKVVFATDECQEAVYERGGYQGKYETKWTIAITGEKDV